MRAANATIFVVDDDTSVRRSLARLLRAAGWGVETFPSARQFLERSPYAGVGCLVLDVRMPGMTGPELHERMSAHGVGLPIVFLTGHADVPTGVHAMKQGAVDYLQKPVDQHVLLEAIRQAIERNAAHRTQDAQRRTIEARTARLSPREREVMKHVIRGRLNKQIADDLGIAEKTVKAHRGEVMAKMQAGSVAELVRMCDASGIGMAERNGP